MSIQVLRQVASKFLIDDEGCWEWTAAKRSNGYGALRVAGKTRQAHRVVYELFVGPIPEGFEIDHLCRNRACVRLDHMEPVPKRVNIARGFSLPSQNARKTHCVRGHELAGDNLCVLGNGWRQCRACHAMHERKYRRQRKAPA